MKSGCPDNETLTKAFQNDLSKRGTDNLVDHVFNCPKCRLKFEALKKIGAELKLIENNIIEKDSPSIDPIPENEKKRSRKISYLRYSYIVTTALIFILAIGIGYLLLHQKENRPVFRDSGPAAFELIEPKGELSSIPSKFLWNRIPDADRFIFRVIDEDLNTIINRNTYSSQYILTNVEMGKISRKKIYLWSVACMNDGDERIGFAQTYFEIR
jgi:hypothetical protein